MMMMIPEAWESHTLMDRSRRAFYEYHAAMMEPWDGPAAIAFTDGRQIGATLDRNGLRPARYIVTDDDLVIMGSECGCLPMPEENIVKKWRLQPGKMFLVDLEEGRIIDDKELKDTLASAKPYGEWIERIRIKLDDLPEATGSGPSRRRAAARPPAGVRLHAGRPQVHPGADGAERRGADRLDGQRFAAGGAVGQEQDALPLLQAALRAGHQPADRPDPRRAGDVARLVHRAEAEPARHRRDRTRRCGWKSAQPVLDFDEMEKIRHIERYTSGKFKSCELDISYPVAWGKRRRSRRARVARARRPRTRCAPATTIIIISDRKVDRDHVADPGAARDCRRSTSIWSQGPAHVAPAWSSRPAPRAKCITSRCSAATAPKRCIRTSRSKRSPMLATRAARRDVDGRRPCKNFIKAIGKGLKKVMSKMGISTYMSYTRRADLRGGRTAARARRQVLHRHGVATSRASASSKSPRKRCACTSAAFGDDPLLASALDAGGEYA